MRGTWSILAVALRSGPRVKVFALLADSMPAGRPVHSIATISLEGVDDSSSASQFVGDVPPFGLPVCRHTP